MNRFLTKTAAISLHSLISVSIGLLFVLVFIGFVFTIVLAMNKPTMLLLGIVLYFSYKFGNEFLRA